MEIHRQQCQACESYELNNILAREENAPTVVYVRCARCGDLVARYELADYYHHGRGIESFLRSRTVTVAESGRQMLELFEATEQKALAGYRKVVAELARQGKVI